MVSNDKMVQETKVITDDILKQMAYRSFLIQGSFNYARMQAGGWTYSLIPGLKAIYKDDEEGLKRALVDHLQFFNTSPHISPFVQGVVIALEENGESREAIQGVKVGLMGPIGGIGDALFHLTLLPISAGIGASLALEGNMLGPLVFLALYNIPYIYAKFKSVFMGYNLGTKAIESLSTSTKKLARAGTILGMTVVGALIAKTVRFNLDFIINAGQVEINLQQDLFDPIMPKLLPLLITLLSFRALKKKPNPSLVIGIMIIVGLLFSFMGIM